MADIYWHRNVMSQTITLDASGLMCPLPVLKLRKRLASLAEGDLISMIATDPAAVIDVPHYCQESGHELVEQHQAGERLTFVVRCCRVS